MAKEIENVLVGVATLFIREPNDAIAEWSTEQYQAGARSVKLYKGGSGNAGSTHLEIIPPAGTTMALWTAAITNHAFDHYCSAVLGNFAQMEFRFEDPNSLAWAEITLVPLQTYLGTAAWVTTTMANNTQAGYGGRTELDTPFFEWGLIDANLVEAAISALDGAACAPEDWLLTRVRIELWEAEPLRTMFIDTVTIMGVAYTVEPGGTAPAMSLSSPFTEVGYTEDGVTVEYTAEGNDIEVEEETVPIDWALTKETIDVTCTMAESSLNNLKNAMSGGALSGNILTVGAGVRKTMNIKIVGRSPGGYITEMFLPKVVAIGAVGMSFKKDEKTMVPITLHALKPSGSPAFTVVYNAA